jgi:ubiquinone/menaquinone biosynthesis C-methylase UbiE
VKPKNVLLGALGMTAAGFLVWRWISRVRHLPCPHWMAWMLENPVVEAIRGTRLTLELIGVRPGERCLDVGAGPGRLTLPAARLVGPTGSVVALDAQPEMLERLRARLEQERLENVTLVRGDIALESCLAEESESFDRAWLVTVLGEIPYREVALRNLFRLLKPGATLSLTEFLPDPHFQRRCTVITLCREAGFEEGDFNGSAFAYTQNFVKPAATA